MDHSKFLSKLTTGLTHKENQASLPKRGRHSGSNHNSRDTESTTEAICVWKETEEMTHAPTGVPFTPFYFKTGNPVIWDHTGEGCTWKEINRAQRQTLNGFTQCEISVKLSDVDIAKAHGWAAGDALIKTPSFMEIGRMSFRDQFYTMVSIINSATEVWNCSID